jgi:LysR family cyn operon transcriptional activator
VLASNGPPQRQAELRHLRAFVAVARTGNVSRAAEQIGLTQPRVSQQLMELEEALGCALFARVGRRLTLTPAGRRFLTHAEEVLEKLDVAMRAATGAPEGDDEHLRVGVVPACGARFIPAILGVLAHRHAALTVFIDEVSADDIERDIEVGRLDLGLGFLPHGSPSLDYKRLLREKFRLVLRSDHPLAGRRSVPMSILEGLTLAVLPSRYYMRHLIDQMTAKNRVKLRIRFELSSVSSILRTVQESGLATLLPPFAVAPSPDLVTVELSGKQPFVEVGIMTARVEGHNTPVERFGAAAIEVIAASRQRSSDRT